MADKPDNNQKRLESIISDFNNKFNQHIKEDASSLKEANVDVEALRQKKDKILEELRERFGSKAKIRTNSNEEQQVPRLTPRP